ncbi:MAG: DUF4340 domain-containing protein [Bacteroidetes bacterium]|jgi:hypothetical protein|nr:DUF4340 domain-containing protein [Bacteroidota bacterium]
MPKRKLQTQALLLASLAILAAIIYLFNNEQSSIKPKDKAFAYNALYKINKISISNNDTSLTLNNESGNNWIVNNHYPANDQSVKALQSVLSRLEAVAPLANINRAQTTKNLFNKGTRVDLYQHNQPSKTYYFYYDTASNQTYSSLGNKDAIFTLKIKAADVRNVVQYFNTSVGYWKDNHIFKLPPEQIQVIQLQYPDNPEQSFTINNTQQPPELYDHQGKKIENVNIEKINNYFYYYSAVKYSEIINPANYRVLSPFVTIQVIHNNDTTGLQLFRKPTNHAHQPYDLNQLLGKTHYEYCLLKYVEIDPLVQKLNYFVKK